MADIKKRMEWLDAMRGFTMILVVAYHVAQMGFGQSEKISASLPFLVLFRMPLFFFVSGFLAYKASAVWTWDFFGSLVWKKVKIQVLPAFIFLCAYIILRGQHDFADGFMRCMASPTKGGYWFTWVLLLMFLVYYVFAAAAQKVRSNAPIGLLWVFAFALYASINMPREFGKYWKSPFYMYSSVYELMKFFQFFLFGNLVHRYWDKVQKLFDTNWFCPFVITVAFFSCADFFRWHTCTGELTNIPKTFAMYSLMLLVVMFFRHYQEAFTKQTFVGQRLQYIGVRTLDIYLLHFILLPKLPMVGEFLDANHPNFVLDIVAAVPVALIVIMFCCLVSNVLRISPILREYLFGRK
jgi:fucose 4-O-acetylase-like acetyltransferase